MSQKSKLEQKCNIHISESRANDNDKNVRPTTEFTGSNDGTEVFDLSKKGEPIQQIILKQFPKKDQRCFRAAWYKQFEWLEYSVMKDAAFCYACRQFNKFGSKETAYTEQGFRNWKNALDHGRGFPKHEKSETHIQAMAMWKEKEIRDNSSTAVSTLVNDSILEKHRYYVKCIIEIIQFLVVNELALRGEYVLEEHAETGLFNKLFEYTLKKDKTLAECAATIPKNSTYRSPEIQNEVIGIMASVVRESVSNDIRNSDVPFFTLLEDGTRDKNNRENIAIAVRYVKDGQIKESLLDLITTENFDAETFTNATLKTLEENKIDTSHLLSQCFDGASVMSGRKGGVAALIQRKLERNIPYVHCFNHRLHLVIIKTINEIFIVKNFFEQCIMLHNFFQHGKVAAIYEGNTIVRLLEQRWSGHFKITKVIFSNYAEIIKVLSAIPENKKFDGEDIATSKGIKSVMLSMEFRFCLVLCKKVLGILDPADSILQGTKCSFKDGVKVIKSVTFNISSLRNETEYASLIRQAEQLIPETEKFNQVSKTGKRKRTCKNLKDFIITEKIPSSSSTNSVSENENSPGFKIEFYETIDMILSELNERFLENEEILIAISSVDEFEETKIECLRKLGKLKLLLLSVINH